MTGPSTLSMDAKEKFPWPTQSEPILPVHIFRVRFVRDVMPFWLRSCWHFEVL